jgi:hypothetical protein
VHLGKNFKIFFNGSSHPPELINCGRYFGAICFYNYQFDRNSLFVLFELLTKVGPFIKEISFHSVDNIDRVQLNKLLSLTNNVETLNFIHGRIFESNSPEELRAIKFPKLKKLCINMHNYYDGLFSQIFWDAPAVEDLELVNSLNVLWNKPKLKKLQITSQVQNEPEVDFNVALDDEIQLKDLKLINFSVKRGQAFENFKSFIQKQRQIESLDFIYTKPPIREYKTIISHILNLETLHSVRTVNDAFEFYFPGHEFRNHRVKNLNLECRYHIRQSNNIEEFIRIFPSIKSLWVSVYSLPFTNILQINALNHLEEFSIVRPQVCQYASHQRFPAKEILETIQIKNLKKFSLTGCEPEDFSVFTQRNPNIVEFSLGLRTRIDWDSLVVLLINLKLLKKLAIKKICGPNDYMNFDWEEKIYEIIGQVGEHLEHFEIDFGPCGYREQDVNFSEFAKGYFKEVLPNLNCNFIFQKWGL